MSTVVLEASGHDPKNTRLKLEVSVPDWDDELILLQQGEDIIELTAHQAKLLRTALEQLLVK